MWRETAVRYSFSYTYQMLLEAVLATFAHLAACPAPLSSTQTSISALSNSSSLSLCVAKAVLVKGSNGSLTLVIGTSSSAPSCLVYPNGLSPDVTLSLLQSGHQNCWSLYPPSAPVVIVNLGKPSKTKTLEALKSFRPQTPLITFSPAKDLLVGQLLSFSNSARQEVIKSEMLNLPVQVRFTPKSFSWLIGDAISSLANPMYRAQRTGVLGANLAVSFGIEYEFVGLTGWVSVSPNLIAEAIPLDLVIGSKNKPKSHIPRLVLRPCFPGSWGC